MTREPLPQLPKGVGGHIIERIDLLANELRAIQDDDTKVDAYIG
jgi:hypothetical protein